MISSTAEYALRAVVFLSERPNTPISATEVAKVTQVPAGYLSKILGNLARHNIVATQRGPGGGCKLIREPEDLTVYDVLLAVDPPKRIHSCPLGLADHSMRLCLLHQRLDDVMRAAEDSFRVTTIAEIVQDRIKHRGPTFPAPPEK